jgi:hypothetical protein
MRADSDSVSDSVSSSLPEDFEQFWLAHKNWSPKETYDVVVRVLIGKNGSVNWDRFRQMHPRWCAYWEKKGWNSFGSLTMLGWIEAKMPEPPPEAAQPPTFDRGTQRRHEANQIAKLLEGK